MKPTGIVRRVDDLGRVVIPKEVRNSQGIREGSPLEIFVEDGAIVLKKYPIEEKEVDARQDFIQYSFAKYGKDILNILHKDEETFVMFSTGSTQRVKRMAQDKEDLLFAISACIVKQNLNDKVLVKLLDNVESLSRR